MEELGIPMNDVTIVNNDTALGPWDVGVHASHRAGPGQEHDFRLRDGWPPPAPLGHRFGAMSTGSAHYRYLDRNDAGSVTTEPLVAGRYWVGVQGWKGGEALHPVGAGLIELEPGEVRIHFELVRQGTLRGRVHMTPIASELSIGLRDSDGRLVQTQVVRGGLATMDTVSPTGASGAFLIERAPVGTYDLEVGLPQAIRAGNSQARIEVSILPGDNEPLEIKID